VYILLIYVAFHVALHVWTFLIFLGFFWTKSFRERCFSRQNAKAMLCQLPLSLVAAHILSVERLPDPVDLARLRAVSHAVRDVVAATGRTVKELTADEAGYIAFTYDEPDVMYLSGRAR
jgi:hypothetical protein